jgi:DNA-binding NarL/FixJ family response regulator
LGVLRAAIGHRARLTASPTTICNAAAALGNFSSALPAQTMTQGGESAMNVLVADDQPIMRLGIRQLIEGEWPGARVDEAATLDAALRGFASQRPDLIVLDLALPDAAGTEGIARMLQVAGETPILVHSAHAESALALRLLQMGAAGYLSKDRAADELVVALRRLSQGRRYVSASVADCLVDRLGGRTDAGAPHEQLSTQEHRVMLLIAAGKTPAEIADTMRLSVRTVGTYRARTLEKTGLKNNVELTKYCVRHGLTDQS